MTHLYVASQDSVSREWIPIAELREAPEGFELRFTRGAQRVPGFTGLGRMQALDKIYFSRTLFPFFANRLISKSRPEFRDYLKWIGLDSLPSSPMEVLGITGGIRATDSYELVAPPRQVGSEIELTFFSRGLRYQEPASIAHLADLSEGTDVFMMRDVQNERDPLALAIRSETPHAQLVGYVPRYYCPGLVRLLEESPKNVRSQIKRLNFEAPLDMRLLISVTATAPESFNLFADLPDFLPLSAERLEDLSTEALSRTDLSL
jgi:hypothetical protein